MEVSWLNPLISPHVARAVMSALSLSPDARPQSIQDFLATLIQPHALATTEQPRSTPEAVAPQLSLAVRQETHIETAKVEVAKQQIALPIPPTARRVVHSFGAGQAPRVRLRVQGTGCAILAIAFSHDSDTIISLTANHHAHIWSTGAGALMRTVPLKADRMKGRRRGKAEGAALHCAAIAPTGELLACGYEDGTVRVWEMPTGKLRHTLKGHAGRVNDLKFSADSARLASGSNDGTSIIWGMETGDEVHTWSEESGSVRVVEFSHDNQLFVTGSDSGVIRLWDMQTSDLIWQQDGHEFWATSLAFSIDGKLLASGSYDRTICIWRIECGQILHTLNGHEGCIAALAFHPNGSTLASAGLDNTIRIWHAPSGQMKHTLGGHDEPIRSLVFTPDGSTLASAAGEEIRLWQGG